MLSRFVHPVKGDRDGALHFCPGDLGQILGVEDEEISWSLGTRSRYNGEQDSCGIRGQQTGLLVTSTVNGLDNETDRMIHFLGTNRFAYRHPHRPHRGSAQIVALRDMNQVPAIPMSPWSSRSTYRSVQK